ncbi:MAG: pyruvate ferredoxin oxidoreductase [Candidatus Moranbacteria bacterium]|nr:pyruvate ferredoxin oxidoreductase [Candidatus Moranbacteria bacterium]
MNTQATNNKNDSKTKFSSGHRTCAGCPAPLIVRTVLKAIEDPVIVSAATGCLEVTTTIYPQTSWNVPFIHSAFENVSATISGIEAAYKNLKQRPQLMQNKNFKLSKSMKFVAFGGDGGTYDIGLQSLSGALERGHDFLYICYNNEGYMNTGGQRSGATTQGASTSTTPSGSKSFGKIQVKKNLLEIVEAHGIAYLAQASTFNLMDLEKKVKKAMTFKGPKFINVLSPCPTVWKFPPNLLRQINLLAVDTLFWPIYEIENGVYNINYRPKEKVPVEEFLKLQKRFRHLFKDEDKTVINQIQNHIDEQWQKLQTRAENTNK